jgi:hypothetical protein
MKGFRQRFGGGIVGSDGNADTTYVAVPRNHAPAVRCFVCHSRGGLYQTVIAITALRREMYNRSVPLPLDYQTPPPPRRRRVPLDVMFIVIGLPLFFIGGIIGEEGDTVTSVLVVLFALGLMCSGLFFRRP